MDKKGSANIYFLLGIIILIAVLFVLMNKLGILDYKSLNFLSNHSPFPKPTSFSTPQQVFTNPPSFSEISCTDSKDCPQGFKCQADEGIGFACSNGQTSPCPTPQIVKGTCKLDEGQICGNDSDCLAGLVCHNLIEASMKIKKCTKPSLDTSCSPDQNNCPSGYTCVQKCGPPVARVGDTPPGFYCLIDELASKPRNCPICLASNTVISTPDGEINIKRLQEGMKVWSVNSKGERIASNIIKIASTKVPKGHQVIHLVLSDGRQLWVSPNHPTIEGVSVQQLKKGQIYDGSLVEQLDYVSYWDDKTYDLLPDSETGFYFASGILMGSTLK